MRLEELEKNNHDDDLYKSKQDEELAKNVALDDSQRQIKVLTLEKDALQGELDESHSLVKEKEDNLQRIYKKLSEKQVTVK